MSLSPFHQASPAGSGSLPADEPAEATRIATAPGRVVWRSGLARSAAVASLGPLLVCLLLVVRSPAIAMQGRLWAEESLFLAHMLTTKSSLHQVFYLYRGHLELLTSTVFAVASHAALELVPLVTSYCGLLVECALAFMIVFFRKDLALRSGSALLLCALIVVSPTAAENHFNMLNSGWVTTAILLLVINLPPARLRQHRPTLLLLSVVLGLSGIPAASLAPLALLHSLVWRSRPHLLIAATLVACCLVQGALLWSNGVHDRFSGVSAWVYLAGPFVHLVLEHSLGVDTASAVGQSLRNAAQYSAMPPSAMLAPLALLIWAIVFLVRKGDSRPKLLVAAIVYLTVFNITFAVGDRNDLFTVYAMRYFFVPSFALALLLARTDRASTRWGRGVVPGGLLFVALVSGKDFFQNPYNGLYVEQRHAWARDVERCRLHGSACSIDLDPTGVSIELPAEVVGRRVP